MDVKTSLLHTNHIAILLSPQASLKDVQICQGMSCALKKLGKDVQIEKTSFNPSSQTQNSLPGRTCTVTLKGLGKKISQVSYERNAEDLKLHFNLQQGNISPENISFDVEGQAGLTIIVGNAPHRNNGSISQLTHISDAEAYTQILELMLNHEDPSFRLLGTTLLKLEYSKATNIYTAFLSQDDFSSSDTDYLSVTSVLKDLKEYFGSQSSYLLLFEKKSPPFLQGILWSPDGELRQQFLSQPKAVEKQNWVLFAPSQKEKQQLEQHLFPSSF